MRRGVFDVIVLVLAGPTFRAEHAAAVDIFEIPKGELIMHFGLLAFFVIYPEIPSPVFGEPVLSNNSFSCCAEGWCSLHASRSSNTNLPSLISLLAYSYARLLSFTVMLFLLLRGPPPAQGAARTSRAPAAPLGRARRALRRDA